MMDQQQSSWTVKKSCSHRAKKCSVKGVSFNYGKKIQIKKHRYKGRKRRKERKKEKKIEKKLYKRKKRW